MDKKDRALGFFRTGYNCAQAVTLTFSEEDSATAKAAAGFGGGMGRTQGTCGAVTGAIMVLGIMNGEKASDNNELKSGTYSLVKELIAKFTDEFKTISCSGLTACDFNSDSGNEKFKNEEVMKKICAPCVKRAVEIVETLS